MKRIFILAALLGTVVACNEDKIFEKEQYKNVFSLVSDENNIYSMVLDLEEDENIGYISASMGGTNPTTEDLVIQLEEAPELLDSYNFSNFDVETGKYYPALPKSKYDIESFTLRIKAGEIGGEIPVRIRPAGLSPDSLYFIPVRVASYNAFELNPDKTSLLFRVRTQNRYAVSDGTSAYAQTMKRKLKSEDFWLTLPATKTLYPLSSNSVRINPGAEAVEAKITEYNKKCIVVEVNDDNTVTLKPFKNIVVTQIDGDPDYPNIFRIVDDGYKTYKEFLLYYEYWIPGTFANTIYQVKEELRLEFSDTKDDYEWTY
ncbi:MAG: DUF1735 domain-containing protein [Bacteroidales bacterium]|jgi:hypothetical protein|nr:DUF1735 domain-containing protein [Bacteroidales bacterium]